MNAEILNRKGARKVEEVPSDVLVLLNTGEIETVNLTEWLAIDHAELVEANFQQLGVSKQTSGFIVGEIKKQKKPTAMNSVKLVGALLYQQISDIKERNSLFERLNAHKSDTIRSYAPFLIALNNALSIDQKLMHLKPIVADKHFGVREVVWMAIRPEIDAYLEESLIVLAEWAEDEDENIRRFTTEATRPRGVWCKHIDQLKAQPELALPILEKLKSDPSKYVQDSVGNWLNDASKSQPQFVIDLCDRWQQESTSKETQKIIKRARRTIDKK